MPSPAGMCGQGAEIDVGYDEWASVEHAHRQHAGKGEASW